MKTLIPILCLVIFPYVSCKKADVPASATATPPTAASANGYWKGATSTYGIGLIIRSSGTARELINLSSLTLDDTSSNNVAKFEGTYSIAADSIFVNSNTLPSGSAFSLKGKMNSSFSSMAGASKLTSGSGGFAVNQIFTMAK